MPWMWALNGIINGKCVWNMRLEDFFRLWKAWQVQRWIANTCLPITVKTVSLKLSTLLHSPHMWRDPFDSLHDLYHVRTMLPLRIKIFSQCAVLPQHNSLAQSPFFLVLHTTQTALGAALASSVYTNTCGGNPTLCQGALGSLQRW